MIATPFSLTVKQAAWLTAQFVLFQLGFFVLIGFVEGFTRAALQLPLDRGTIGSTPPVAAVVNSLACFFVVRALLRRKALWLHSLIRCGFSSAWQLIAVLAISAGTVVLLSELENLVRTFAPTPKVFREMFAQLGNLARFPWSAPFLLIVIAPITEELLFRGLILRGLLGVTTARRAIVLSAVLFTLMHLNPWQFPPAFVLGLAFGWIYLRTQSLGLCITAHAVHNAVFLLATGLPFSVRGFNVPQPDATTLFQPVWFNLLGAALLAVGVVLFHRSTPRAPKFAAEPPPLSANQSAPVVPALPQQESVTVRDYA